MVSTQRIRTERLVFESRTVEHAAELCEALAGDSVGRYIGGPEVTTLDAMVARLRYVAGAQPERWGERWLNWVVRAGDEPDEPLVGRIEATVHVARTPIVAEVAYVFGPAWSGRGYATEATNWMLEHLRDEHAVAVAYATVAPQNATSVRLLERLAFEPCDLPPDGLGSFDEGDLVFGLGLA